MAGNKAGGLKAAATNKQKYGEDFYKKNALRSQEAWHKNGRKPRGFLLMTPEQRSAAGKKGGAISRRGKSGQPENL